MLKKKETEENSRECLRSKECRHFVGHELDEWRASLYKITTLAKNLKLFCCMFFHSYRQRIYDNSKDKHLFD